MEETFKDFNIIDFFSSVGEFIKQFSENVMTDDMRGLIMYFFNCFPNFIRAFFITGFVLFGLAVLYDIIRK